MENIFYLELAKMAQEALDELDRYESTINYSGGAAVFDKIRAISVPCLDGEKISQSVKDDLPIRDQLEFQRAIFSMANLSSLSGGIGKNQNIKSKISYVLNKATTLSSRSQKTKTLKIFYSWQATLPSKTNRGLIRDCLDKAISEINKGLSIESRVILDSDTSNTSGSPDIINTILKKIDTSQIFIADVSLVNSSQPNANVMFELGYAMKTLGDQNIIMVFNESYGATKDLPFDLGFKRQMLYRCSSSEEDMASARKSLTSKLKSAISLILNKE